MKAEEDWVGHSPLAAAFILLFDICIIEGDMNGQLFYRQGSAFNFTPAGLL